MFAMTEWVAVVASEHADPVEVQTEPDGTLSLATVDSQFPGVTGLRFRHPDTNGLRGVRCHDHVLYPPDGNGWGDANYICVWPPSEADRARFDDVAVEETGDLYVAPLPFGVTEWDIRNYFESFGRVARVAIKRYPDLLCKGYGFVRFLDVEAQKKVLELKQHLIYGCWCKVKPPLNVIKQDKTRNEDPDENGKVFEDPNTTRKVFEDPGETRKLFEDPNTTTNKIIFVASTSERLTSVDMLEHFKQFGAVAEVSVPPVQPFRSFAYVTFAESNVAQSLHGQEHNIKGMSASICMANAEK